MRKRLLALLLSALMLLSLAACGSDTQEETSGEETPGEETGTQDFGGAELVVATWGWAEAGLMELAADFEETYNCTIVVDPTSGNIDTSVVTSLDHLYDFALDANGYGPCYSLCRYGIMYNADALEQLGLEPPTSYQDLFDDKYAGMVALPDMTSTAGPYMLVAMAEAMGGSQEDVTPAMTLMQEKKDNINIWYTASSDVVNAFTTGEANITVFMDINMPGLMESGLNMVWVDAEEGSFAAPATINVVKGCQNPELAQLFVEYMISDETQSKVAEAMNEAPVNKNATMPDELKTYLAFGEDAMSSLKEFDETYISQAKEEWIDTFQRTVAVQ